MKSLSALFGQAAGNMYKSAAFEGLILTTDFFLKFLGVTSRRIFESKI